MARSKRTIKPLGIIVGEPFDCAEEAWIWAVRGHDAIAAGAILREGEALIPRPCEPRDIMIAMSRLVRAGAVGTKQVRTLFRYGRLGYAPDWNVRAERASARLWDAAMDRLSTALFKKALIIEPIGSRRRVRGPGGGCRAAVLAYD